MTAKPIGREFNRKLLALVESLTPEQKREWRDALLDQTVKVDRGVKMYLPIPACDWTCPAGHKRELLGVEGSRRLRCKICEGCEGNFLTEFDRVFLRDATVKIQAD
jgi:hypothetical protein